MQIFRVEKPSCTILKTKNCVPFEVQYTSTDLSKCKLSFLFSTYYETKALHFLFNLISFHDQICEQFLICVLYV